MSLLSRLRPKGGPKAIAIPGSSEYYSVWHCFSCNKETAVLDDRRRPRKCAHCGHWGIFLLKSEEGEGDHRYNYLKSLSEGKAF